MLLQNWRHIIAQLAPPVLRGYSACTNEKANVSVLCLTAAATFHLLTARPAEQDA